MFWLCGGWLEFQHGHDELLGDSLGYGVLSLRIKELVLSLAEDALFEVQCLTISMTYIASMDVHLRWQELCLYLIDFLVKGLLDGLLGMLDFVD